MVTRRTCGGSEADAYRYTKKVLSKLNFSTERLNRYVSEAESMGESSWTRHCFNNIRRRFFHNGISDIRFAPGVARIAYGELDMDDDWEDDNSLLNLDTIIRMISEHHRNDYNRHLNYVKYSELDEMFGVQLSDNLAELKNVLKSREYGPRRYKIIWMENYSVGQPYYQYTTGVPSGSWCYLNSESTFKSYTKGGSTKLYLALMEGFENITPDDPEYGPSMLGIDIGPNGELIHVNNRWNHAHDHIDKRKGDNKYTAEELSDLLGGPYFEICPPFTEDELLQWGFTKKKFSQIFASAQRGIFIDPRDGRKYHTVRLCNRTWIVENIKYIAHADKSEAISPFGYTFNPNHFEYGPYYNGDAAPLAVPPGCRLPSENDWQSLVNFLKLNQLINYFNDYITVADDIVMRAVGNNVRVHQTVLTNDANETLGQLDDLEEGEEEINVVDAATGDEITLDLATARDIVQLHDTTINLTDISTGETIHVEQNNQQDHTDTAVNTEPATNEHDTETPPITIANGTALTVTSIDGIGLTANVDRTITDVANHAHNDAGNATGAGDDEADAAETTEPAMFNPWRPRPIRSETNRCKMNLLGFGALTEGVGFFNIFEDVGKAAYYWGNEEGTRMDPHSTPEPMAENTYDAEDYFCTYSDYEKRCGVVNSKFAIHIDETRATTQLAPKNYFMCVKCIVND